MFPAAARGWRRRKHHTSYIFFDGLYLDGGKLLPEAVGEVGLLPLSSYVVEGVGEVPLHLGSCVRGLEALNVLVDEGHQARDVATGDLQQQFGEDRI